MRMITTSVTLAMVLAMTHGRACSEDASWKFLDKYLVDPYRVMDGADLGFAGPIFMESGSGLSDSNVEALPLACEARDMNSDGRADLLIPIKKKLGEGKAEEVFHLAIVYNLAEAISVTRKPDNEEPGVGLKQHFSSSPALIANSPLGQGISSGGTKSLFADLNADGLVDAFVVAVPTEEDRKNGALLSITQVQMNLGHIGYVPEDYVPHAVRDVRLGYVASFAEAVLGNAGAASEALSSMTELSQGPRDFKFTGADIYEGPFTGGALPLAPSELDQRWDVYKALDDEPTDSVKFDFTNIPEPGTDSMVAEAGKAATSDQPFTSDFLSQHPEIDFGIITKPIVVSVNGKIFPKAYMPDASSYSAGLRRGGDHAKDYVRKQRRVFVVSDGLVTSARQFTRVKGSMDLDDVSQVAKLQADAEAFTDSVEAVDPGSGDVEEKVADSLSLVLASPVFLPARLDVASGKPIANVKGESEKRGGDSRAHMVSADSPVLDAGEVKSLLQELHVSWAIKARETEGVVVVNAPRIVGMALAFLTQNALRSGADYKDKLKNPAEYEPFDRQIKASLSGFAGDLSFLSRTDAPEKALGHTLATAALSSGYMDLPAYISNDRYVIAFEEGYKQGYEQGKADALILVRTQLAGAIPDLAKSQTVEQAVMAISGFLANQQKEIQRLNGVVEELEKVVRNLNGLLEDARSTIRNLNTEIAKKSKEISDVLAQVGSLEEEKAQLLRTLQATEEAMRAAQGAARKAGRAADAIGLVAKAGAGAIIAGPVGAVVCALFC